MNNRILNKIKKLMAMVERGNPHESANAMKKVQALMAEHQLSSEDVALSGIDASKVKAANSSERLPNLASQPSPILSATLSVSKNPSSFRSSLT